MRDGITYHKSRGILVFYPDHPRAGSNGYVAEHILLAERILGRPLPPLVVIHHPKGNQDNSIFVICENRTYHALLHQRMRSLLACGNATWRKCAYCKKHDDPKNLFFSKAGSPIYHRVCMNEYIRNRNDDKMKLIKAVKEIMNG